MRNPRLDDVIANRGSALSDEGARPLREREQSGDPANFPRRPIAERVEAVHVCLAAGVAGITVHPRADARHITPQDVHDVAAVLKAHRREYNIEGDPRPDLLALVHDVRPDQCTLVPVAPGEITSQAGWGPGPQTAAPGGPSPIFRRWHSRQSLCRSPPESIRFASSAAPIASSSTRSRLREHSSRARGRARSFALRSRGRAGVLARDRRQRRPRSRPRQPPVSGPAAPRRGLDRPRYHVARAVCRPGYRVRPVPRCSVSGPAAGFGLFHHERRWGRLIPWPPRQRQRTGDRP